MISVTCDCLFNETGNLKLILIYGYKLARNRPGTWKEYIAPIDIHRSTRNKDCLTRGVDLSPLSQLKVNGVEKTPSR